MAMAVPPTATTEPMIAHASSRNSDSAGACRPSWTMRDWAVS